MGTFAGKLGSRKRADFYQWALYLVSEVDPLIETLVTKLVLGPKPLDDASKAIVELSKKKLLEEHLPLLMHRLGNHQYFGGDKVSTGCTSSVTMPIKELSSDDIHSIFSCPH